MKKLIIKETKNSFFEVTIELPREGHNYFSITGSVYKAIKNTEWADTYRNGKYYEMTLGGCIHEEILKIRPDFNDLVDLHLSGPTGIPMYALENGFYHYKEGKNNLVKELLRISEQELKELLSKLEAAKEDEKRFVFSAFVQNLLPRYNDEALKAIEKYS